MGLAPLVEAALQVAKPADDHITNVGTECVRAGLQRVLQLAQWAGSIKVDVLARPLGPCQRVGEAVDVWIEPQKMD